MSGESKFAKLRLPVSKRNKIATSSSSSQISAFFAKSTPSTSIDLDENSENSTFGEQTRFKSENETDHQLPSSLPERKISESTSSDSKPLFASFEAIKPSKLRRIDSSKPTNRSTIKEFFAANGNENDFESPPAKVAKKATTFKKKQRTTSKRQPKIKNALYKREQMISNFIAEQSMAEDIDPNEMQMALALSKSEVETFRIEGDPEASNASSNSTEAICEKLAEFGYRVGRGNNNNQLYGKLKGKAKWANKFTSLTLRDAERQQEKVNKKIEEFLNNQCTGPKNIKTVLHKPFEIASSFLSHMKTDNFIHQRHRNYEFYNINNFYVTDIIEPTINKVGNLLKDFHAIPGRDKSPPRVLITKDKEGNIQNDGFNFTPKHKDENTETSVFNQCTPSQELHVVSSSTDSTNHNFCRANSPDLFMEEEEEDIPEGKNSTEKLLEVETTPKIINQQLSMDIVTLSSESNSNGILTCEKFSSDEVKISDRTGIWNQDLSYTLKHKNEETEIEEPEKLIDLTQDDLVDLTQSDIEADKDDENLLQNSLRSTKSAGTDMHSSQDSSSSIIVLSDDEVNYSIKVARGMNVSGNSTDKSDTECSNLNIKHDAGTSVEGIDKETENDSPWNNLDSDSHDNFENNLECNNLSQLSNISGVDKLNYSLAQEIMSRSFEEEFDKINFAKSIEKHEASLASDMPFLDLTQSTSPCVRQEKKDSSIGNLSQNVHNEFCDIVDNNTNDIIDQQPNANQHFIFEECNTINSPKYTELIDDANNYSSSREVKTPPLVELAATHCSNKVYETDDVPCLDLTDSTPPNSEEISYPSNSMHSLNDSINTSRKFRKTYSDSFLVPKNKTSKSLKRFSSSNKFEDFLNVNSDEGEPDEFDRLVYIDPQNANKPNTPGSKKPLTDELSCENDSVNEIIYDDKKYLVRTKNVKEKPDYQRMDSPTRLKELYKYGLKPFKRKQAIIMLEYIYNQTHPYILEDESAETNESTGSCNEKMHENKSEEVRIESSGASTNPNKYDLKDCNGSLLVIEDGLYPEAENEEYIFQTNIKSKVSTALLPLHLAWFNLVRSSEKLRELILYYEPIDLQEIFLYFKSIGYRYDPKDLKRFFDGRSIIFQYDLSKDGSNRHIRKSQKQKVRKK